MSTTPELIMNAQSGGNTPFSSSLIAPIFSTSCSEHARLGHPASPMPHPLTVPPIHPHLHSQEWPSSSIYFGSCVRGQLTFLTDSRFVCRVSTQYPLSICLWGIHPIPVVCLGVAYLWQQLCSVHTVTFSSSWKENHFFFRKKKMHNIFLWDRRTLLCAFPFPYLVDSWTPFSPSPVPNQGCGRL